MNKVPFLATLIFSLFLLSCGDSSTSINGGSNQNSYLFCDFGPVTQYGGGCFSINDASECDTEWGQVVTACGSTPTTPSSSSRPSSSSTPTTPQQQAANAVVLTLTYWDTKATSIFGINPKIRFRVIAYSSNNIWDVISDNYSDVLLESKGITSWVGSKRSSPIPFVTQAYKLEIQAVVTDVGTLIDSDISPGYYWSWNSIPMAGTSGTHTMEYGTGKSKVSFNYDFVKQ